MQQVYKLREQGLIWDDVARRARREKRYCQAMYVYFVKEVLKKENFK